MTQLIAEEMMVPSEPGIEIYVRNKRPAESRDVHAGAHAAVRARLDLSGAHRLRPAARRPVVDGVPSPRAATTSIASTCAATAARRGPRQWTSRPQNNPPVVRTPDAVKDVDAVLDFILKRRNIPRLNLLGWSWGCTLMATTTIRNPDKVARLMLYAPPWLRTTPSLLNAGPGPLGAYRTVTREQAKARWLTGVPDAQEGGADPARLVRAMDRRRPGPPIRSARSKIRRWCARPTARWRTPPSYWLKGKTDVRSGARSPCRR